MHHTRVLKVDMGLYMQRGRAPTQGRRRIMFTIAVELRGNPDVRSTGIKPIRSLVYIFRTSKTEREHADHAVGIRRDTRARPGHAPATRSALMLRPRSRKVHRGKRHESQVRPSDCSDGIRIAAVGRRTNRDIDCDQNARMPGCEAS